jgi:hypothetical protein
MRFLTLTLKAIALYLSVKAGYYLAIGSNTH